jgi:hypothetical protein
MVEEASRHRSTDSIRAMAAEASTPAMVVDDMMTTLADGTVTADGVKVGMGHQIVMLSCIILYVTAMSTPKLAALNGVLINQWL